MDKIEQILDFWFEGVDDTTPVNKEADPFRKWFTVNPSFDMAIRAQFEEDLLSAADGKYQAWEQSPEGRLALIILFDQFSRNMYRDTPRMYAYDALGLKMALEAISQKQEEHLPLIYRTFVYMPLMHSEDGNIQKLSVQCFERLVEESKTKAPGNTHYYEYSLKYAQDHHDTVAEFGRFPHRDAVLNRVVA